MHPSERIKHIKDISIELAKEDWALLDLTLKQFGLPWSEQWNGGDKEHYIIEMLSDSKDEALLELAKHLGLASQLESPVEPDFWETDEVRIFLSHLAINKVETSKLKEHLEYYGMSAFVAHEDIEPTKQWQAEIESALASMDGLVALLAPGFKESNWCDQEVGVAIGRKLPILAIRQGLDPYGFIGKYQALQGVGKSASELANEIFELFLPMPNIGAKITGSLVNKLVNSQSFEQSKRLIGLIRKSTYLTSKHAAVLNEAIENNEQISHSWGVPEQIKQIAKQFES
ncbi:toll/interleukin-1 receptor domain-containing protein [Pseudoalteromonas sp. C2R02]|uniref:toll/interleukin-1 receptor domain-containing protein n=1 Tax=Pseudoalteromonas sp. C2R02 TaxID=2841565 RepID=UPI001C090316|nr:toll/interleukin-1 receptor domain-containing protein [Pseudoalteromonas sp. C2R02]MBU2969069.1 toll/interleukin-1 receptor domain-containing protein [Pseudoalteromonas sp. C2R02]